MSAQLQTPYPLERYLRPSPHIDFEHPLIQAFLSTYRAEERSEVQTVQDLFEFVRDQIAHSGDIQSHRVTRKASEVLEHRVGICYAKAHLLAALLRGVGIPSGLCYQRLTWGETAASGHVLHGLNAVYVASHNRWIRLDPRGNKPGVDAQFSLSDEKLAYPIREEQGEIDYPINFPEPHPTIIATLAAYEDGRLMYGAGRLPSDL
jgi:transglutaminase-like putative cysteine protease